LGFPSSIIIPAVMITAQLTTSLLIKVH